ncbi:NAD(P)/FAD-dependent oxidoreductase [Conexibacter sp. SYSU D00693]|uniref:phytoene desaturase family protein n=1 Tax=Conexibacter sp. SYSU D00693 TaxID=2812560 RepID=UPI00196A754E|nr:NAD(P)/FAD-dependent oxidoreductase [Conexibacter sp. SYSU D00693]
MYKMNGLEPDVLVVGAGHNGLTAACYLAKAGRAVTVLEASPTVGGMISTNPVIAGAPGHLVNEGGIQASLFRATPIERDLELRRHGLVQLPADPFHVHVDKDTGASLAFWEDPRRTADELLRFSRKDAAAYLDFARSLDAAMDLAIPFMLSHPTRPDPRTVLAALPTAVRRRKDLWPLTQFLTTSHEQFITERFDHPLVRGALASMPPFCWMKQDGTAWGLIYVGMCHRTGSTRFQGGTGALTDALHSCLTELGGQVRTSAKVETLLVEGERVVGVVLDDGEELRAGHVMATCSPKATLAQMLPKGLLPDHLQRRADSIPTAVLETGTLKIDVAVSGRLEIAEKIRTWRDDGLDLRKPIVSWQTFEEHVQAWDETVGGRWPDPICFIGIVPSAIDPTQAPEGQDTFWLWSGITPMHPQEPWEAVRDAIGDRVLADCAEVYEGLDSLEVGRRVFHVSDLEERFHVPDGNVYHVEPAAARFGPLRPAQGFGAYETPVPGLWISGAGTHPTGGISGIPGYVAARTFVQRTGDGQGSGAARRLRRLVTAG